MYLATLFYGPPIFPSPTCTELELSSKKPTLIVIILVLVDKFDGLDCGEKDKITENSGDVIKRNPDHLDRTDHI